MCVWAEELSPLKMRGEEMGAGHILSAKLKLPKSEQVTGAIQCISPGKNASLGVTAGWRHQAGKGVSSAERQYGGHWVGLKNQAAT